MQVDLAQLLATLTEPPTGISFSGAIARLCGNDAVPEANRLTDSLTRLADQGLVEVGPTTVGLVGACAGLPLHFLVISSVIELANACGSTEAHIRRLGFTCLQAGVNDLLTVERVDDRIHMETLSADTLVRYVDCLVRTPDAEGSTAPLQPQGAGATEMMATPSVQLPSVAPSRAGSAPPWGLTPPAPAVGVPASSGPTYQPGPAVSTAGPVAPDSHERLWRPTHLAPAGGMPAWSTPVGAGVPTARIDAGVELQVLTRAGQWAHIVCSNGWSAWVDGAAMAELRSR